MQTLIFLAIAFLPALICGPVPAMLVFRVGPGLNWRRGLPLAVLLAAILNLIAFVVIVSHLDGLLPPGFFACLLTPLAALVTLIVSLRWLRRTDPAVPADPIQRRWLRLSLVAIPVLQMLMITILILIAPALCGTVLRTCTSQ
jgi:hypothetical protein